MTIRRIIVARLATLIVAAGIIPVSPAGAHEAWLQPAQYRMEQPTRVTIDVMAGENFAGNSLSYNPVRFSRLQRLASDGAVDINGRLGDLPAVQFDAPADGLYSVVYQTTGSEIDYGTAEKFAAFAKKEGLEWVLEAHRQRGLPAADFSETFYRYCKTLIGIGQAQGRDHYAAMPFELVATGNPFTAGIKSIEVRAIWQGKAVSEGQLSVYRRHKSGEVLLTRYLVDAEGGVTVALEPGGEYLLNVVRMEAVEAREKNDPVWRSHWASLTFATAE